MSIYLDSAASTKVKPKVLNTFVNIAEKYYGNPSSEHTEGYFAEKCINDAKVKISDIIHCNSNDIYFTSGATMGNQLLIQGFVAKNPHGMVITTNVEHNDIMLLMNNLDCYKHILKVNTDGIIDLNELEKIIQYSVEEMRIPTLVTIQMANSETGIIQPIHRICKIVKRYSNVFLHMDATQYIPYYPINLNCWGIDSISMSGQKIGGLKGSGLLTINKSLRENIKPVIYGEQGVIGGTPSTPLICSLGVAFEEIDYNTSLKEKRDILLSYLQNMGGILIGGLDNRLPNNIYIRFPNIEGNKLLYILDDHCIYIGTGSACSTDSDKPSHVAKAYGLTDQEAFECVRFTLGNEITYEDINEVKQTLEFLLPLLR